MLSPAKHQVYTGRARALHRYCKSIDRAVDRGETIKSSACAAAHRARRSEVPRAGAKSIYRHYTRWKAQGRPGWQAFMPGYVPGRRAVRSAAFKACVYSLAEHAQSMRAVHDTLVLRWRAGRRIPGLGKAASAGEPFPLSYRTYLRFFTLPERRTLQKYFTARRAFLRLAGMHTK
ncbi:MAG: hypothetical protein JJU00_01270 [Opitutales bacterium]|nr:hypothetical protein [Opitutales bacterium]